MLLNKWHHLRVKASESALIDIKSAYLIPSICIRRRPPTNNIRAAIALIGLFGVLGHVRDVEAVRKLFRWTLNVTALGRNVLISSRIIPELSELASQYCYRDN